jgi:hypothetical protein
MTIPNGIAIVLGAALVAGAILLSSQASPYRLIMQDNRGWRLNTVTGQVDFCRATMEPADKGTLISLRCDGVLTPRKP